MPHSAWLHVAFTSTEMSGNDVVMGSEAKKRRDALVLKAWKERKCSAQGKRKFPRPHPIRP